MKKLVLILLIVSVNLCYSQDYSFGKISKQEIEEKQHPLDSSANAAYLYKSRNTFYEYSPGEGFKLVTEIHERIKIYNKEGVEYATKEINLYKNGTAKEKISSLKAYTYNIVGNKIEEDKLKKDGIFDTELSRFYDQRKFTMPNVKDGSVIEYKYRIISPFIYNIDEYVFQHAIPIKKMEASFKAPEYYSFKINTKGFLHIAPVQEKKRGSIIYTTKSNTSTSFNSSRVKPTTFKTEKVEHEIMSHKYSLENVPALNNEPFVNNIRNYRSAVKYELSFVKFPNEPIDYYTTTWDDVVKSIYKSSSFGDELKKTNYFENDVNELLSGVSAPEQKIISLFNYVKSKVKWNDYYGYFVNDGVRKAYKEGSGNVAEINLMLTAMLRYAGLNANPVLVSTRSNGVPIFPTREGYNYVISAVEVPEGLVLLDASSVYSVPNILPFRTLNWEGRIIRKDGSSARVTLYPNQKSKNTISANFNLSEEGNVEGMIRNMKTTHNALSFRNNYNRVDEEDYLEKLENRYGGIEVSEYEVKNKNNLSKPLMETYKVVKDNQADIIGGKIYFSPLFFLKATENPFKLEKREFPIDFGYPSETMYRINITLPEGYRVEAKPESVALQLPDNLGGFMYRVVVNVNSLQILVETKINSAIVSPMYYDALKDYFSQLVEKENEKIVLSKP